jgi:hypothetical protein
MFSSYFFQLILHPFTQRIVYPKVAFHISGPGKMWDYLNLFPEPTREATPSW